MKEKQISYYAQRAQEYEKVYYKPERQNDLRKLEELLPQLVKAKSVLEIGCGTGYWTQFLSKTAKLILATDINHSMLEIAKSKSYDCETEFRELDYEKIVEVAASFEVIFAGFVISHIRRENLLSFISKLSSKLKRGGELIFVDNRFVEGSNTPIESVDEKGNTFQRRKLEDGSSFKVLKNFYTEEDWRRDIADQSEFELRELNYFYLLRLKNL
ncbi:MAG: class I SAM-dependent methyltransferase [Bacteroidota bacterium]